MQTVILCGGKGTRLAEETSVRPKPMVTVGGHPILWHLLNSYAAQGFKDFTLAVGYLGDYIKNYFLHYSALNSDFEVDLATGEVSPLKKASTDWRVRLIDTGAETLTGGRLLRLEPHIRPTGTFFLTYGDGLSNIDLNKLLSFHKKHGKLVTMSAVRPGARFGGLSVREGQVLEFKEKLPAQAGWINGGFMVMEPGIFDYLDNDETILEQHPMERLVADHQLMAYQHEGFWQCMDTIRDREALEQLWASGRAPWKNWQD